MLIHDARCLFTLTNTSVECYKSEIINVTLSCVNNLKPVSHNANKSFTLMTHTLVYVQHRPLSSDPRPTWHQVISGSVTHEMLCAMAADQVTN